MFLSQLFFHLEHKIGFYKKVLRSWLSFEFMTIIVLVKNIYIKQQNLIFILYNFKSDKIKSTLPHPQYI